MEEKVRVLSIENSALREKVLTIRRLSKITEEDAAAWRNCEDFLNTNDQGSPTPVHNATEENPSQKFQKEPNERKGRRALDDAPNKRRAKPREGNQTVEGRKRAEKDNIRYKNEESSRMIIDGEEEVHTLHRESRKRERRNMPEIRREHKNYLEDCFRKQIGLPTDRGQSISIHSFTDHRVAKGYQKVIATCQGMYYETKHNQVDWEKMGRKRLTVGGDFCWRGEGVTIYQPSGERLNRPIVPHRFAINLGQQSRSSGLRTDRYYIHVYQTKIGPERRTLRSKEIAQEINRRWRKVYFPRPIDIPREWPEKYEGRGRRPRRPAERNRTRVRKGHSQEQRKRSNKRRYTTRKEVDTTQRETNNRQWQHLSDEVRSLINVLRTLLQRKGHF